MVLRMGVFFMVLRKKNVRGGELRPMAGWKWSGETGGKNNWALVIGNFSTELTGPSRVEMCGCVRGREVSGVG